MLALFTSTQPNFAPLNFAQTHFIFTPLLCQTAIGLQTALLSHLSTLLNHTTSHHTALHSLYSTPLYPTPLHPTPPHFNSPQSTALHCTPPPCIASHCIACAITRRLQRRCFADDLQPHGLQRPGDRSPVRSTRLGQVGG